MEQEEVERLVKQLSNELNRSGRGIAVKKQLRTFLDGDACSLDGDHWDSIEALIKIYRAGWRGTVLENI